MKVHLLITLLASTMFHEARPTTLDLDSASSLLLNVLDIRTSMTNNLSTKVKTRDRLEVNRDLLLGPFALQKSAFHHCRAE